MDLTLQVAINRTPIETADPFASLKPKPQTFPTYKEVESSADSPGRRFELVNQETVKEQRKADYKSGMISTPVAVIGSIILGALIGESPIFVYSKAAENFFKEVIDTAHNL